MKWQKSNYLLFGLAVLILVSFPHNSNANVKSSAVEEDCMELNWIYEADNFTIDDIAISGDGNYAIIGGFNGTFDNENYPLHGKLLFFSGDSPSPLWTYNETERIYSVDLSDDGKYAVFGDQNNFTYLMNTISRIIVNVYDCGAPVSIVQISGDGNDYVCRDNDTVYFFNQSQSAPIWSFTASSTITSIALSSDGIYLIIGTKFGKVYLFNQSSSTPLWVNDFGTEIFDVDISDHGEKMVVGRENYTHVFSPDSADPLWSYDLYSDQIGKDKVKAVTISQNGEYIAASVYNNEFGTCYFKSTGELIWKGGNADQEEMSMGYKGEYFSAVAGTQPKIYSSVSSEEVWYEFVDYASNTDISQDERKVIFDSENRQIGNTRYSKLSFYTFTPPTNEEEKEDNSNGEPEQLGVSFGLWFLLITSIAVAVILKRGKPHMSN